MLCHRCGSDVESGATTCGNCGAPVKAGRRTFNRTITSFRGLEQQRQATADGLPARPGELLGGRFALDALIGRGPLGVVFTARDRDNQLDVALKIIDPALLPDDAARDNALTVLERARRLAHDGIVRVYAVGRDDDRLYVASERLEAGLTLAKVLGLRRDKKQRFTVAEAAPIIEQITTALLHAHRHLPHGGLKPENIQLLPTALKLTDFGLAAALPGERYAAAHLTAGELDRIAPELRDGQPPTARADIFGLGAILYEMLAGRAYTADAPSLAAAIGRLDDAPHPMDAIIRRATAADPAQRYENVEAFADAFTTAVDTAPAPGDDDVTRRVAVEDAAPRLAAGAALDEGVTAPNRVRPASERDARGADALDEVVTAPNRVRSASERGRDAAVAAVPELDERGEDTGDGRRGRATDDGSSGPGRGPPRRRPRPRRAPRPPPARRRGPRLRPPSRRRATRSRPPA
ncbi:MAG: protein kinase [Myxococcales bacterium]|nr:protein kinase [Myxococcales bacterium]